MCGEGGEYFRGNLVEEFGIWGILEDYLGLG